jgi:rSAM/selenodomain-associated transferase 2
MGNFTLKMLAFEPSGVVISVIVPVKNEGPEIAVRFSRFCHPPAAELIIADGGVGAATREALRASGARLFCGPGSRGSRLAQAAAQARGEILFFLHADSRAPEEALSIIPRAIDEGADAGAFSLAYESGGGVMRWIAWWANLRSRLGKLPFGDQGIFCRREAYEQVGGFRDLPICDDLDLVVRLKRVGRFVVRPEKTVTSHRRYETVGAFRQVFRNWKVMAGYFAGIAPETLSRWYEGPSPTDLRDEPERPATRRR